MHLSAHAEFLSIGRTCSSEHFGARDILEEIIYPAGGDGNPYEFGSDLVDGGIGARHRSSCSGSRYRSSIPPLHHERTCGGQRLLEIA